MRERADERLEEGRIYDVLSNERRRICVRRIAERDPVAVQRLADELAAAFVDGAVGQSVSCSVYVSLVQTHLPKLDRYGVVDYDEDGKHRDGRGWRSRPTERAHRSRPPRF